MTYDNMQLATSSIPEPNRSVAKYLFMSALQDSNETLYYKLLIERIEEVRVEKKRGSAQWGYAGEQGRMIKDSLIASLNECGRGGKKLEKGNIKTLGSKCRLRKNSSNPLNMWMLNS